MGTVPKCSQENVVGSKECDSEPVQEAEATQEIEEGKGSRLTNVLCRIHSLKRKVETVSLQFDVR